MDELTTDLALERTAMGAERTLQAWIRTALSMISFGFTIGKLGQTIDEIEVKGILHIGSRTFGLAVLVAGLLVLVGGGAFAALVLKL